MRAPPRGEIGDNKKLFINLGVFMILHDTFFETDAICTEILEKIFDNRVIHIIGPNGSGKSFLGQKVFNKINSWEDWAVYHVCGTCPEIEPYATISSIKKSHSISEIGFNIGSFLQLGINISMSNDKKDFSPFEYSILNKILQVPESNILIIADDYHLWDLHSIKLLNTLILKSEIQFEFKKNIHVILITNHSDFKMISDLKNKVSFISYIMHNLDNVGIQNFLFELYNDKSFNPVSEQTLSYIHMLTGGNMTLIKLISDTCQDKIDNIKQYSNEHKLINDIANSRINELYQNLSTNLINVKEVLGIASLFENGFTINDLSYVSENKESNLINILSEAERKEFIKNIPPYVFACIPIQNALREQFNNKKYYYYEKEYLLLHEKKTGDYYQRAMCLEKFADDKPEVIYLYMMAYSRYSLNFDDEIMCKKIVQRINDYVDHNSNSNSIIEANYIFTKFIEIIDNIKHNNYKTAYEGSMKIFNTTSILVESEIQLLKLYCFVLLDNITNTIYELVEDLRDLLEIIKDESEYEQYARILLILLPILIDKLNDVETFNLLRKDLNKIIIKNSDNHFLLYARATLYRKSNLYKSANTAYVDSAQALSYFHQMNLEVDLYYTLCNHAGNLILSNDYKNSIKSSNEAKKLLIKNPSLDSGEKVTNNFAIAKLLEKENEFCQGLLTETELKKEITNSIQLLEQCLNINNINDTTLVIMLNICSLYAYVGHIKKSEENIIKLKSYLEYNDDYYYKYYLLNIELGIAIVKKDWTSAERLMLQLDFVPAMFHKSKRHINKRVQILNEIIKEKKSYTQTHYNFAILNRVNRFADSSWAYFARGFLVSDLQFNSQ